MVKSLPAVQETRVQSLGREDTLEKEMVTHSSIVAWKIPWNFQMYFLDIYKISSLEKDCLPFKI